MTPLGLRHFIVITMLMFGFIRNEIHLSVPKALMLEAGCSMLDAGFWMLGARYWMLDTRSWMLDTRFWILVIDNGFVIMLLCYIFDYHVVVYSLYISLVMQSSDKC